MHQLELRLFGLPEFILNGRRVDELVSAKARALFIYLALAAKPHARLELATMFWDNQTDANALRNLRVALTRLNRSLGEFIHVIGRRELAIREQTAIWIDTTEFDHITSVDQPAVEQLETAVQLYQGHFLEGLHLRNAEPFDEWVWEIKERYRNKVMTALTRLADHHGEQRLYGKAIVYLNRLIALEPWREEAHQKLMRFYALNAQRSAALAQYEQCRTILEKEFGTDPAEATQQLYDQIVREALLPDVVDTAVPLAESAVPFQAPAILENFTDREHLISKVTASIRAEKPTVQALVGMGGVGKSAVAIEIVHRLRPVAKDGVLWANVASGDPTAIIDQWARAYGNDFSRIGDVNNMAAAFRNMLTDKNVLIVLDDVHEAARIRPLLPNGPNNHVLFTTRDHDLARSLNATVWQLDEFSNDDGGKLLSRILGDARVAAEPDAAAEICALLQNLPLAIEITAKRLRTRTRRSLKDTARRLRDETKRLSLLEISDQAVRASFMVSWESLDQRHRSLFAVLGLFNGRSLSADAVAAIGERDPYMAEDQLFNLAALSLVREEANNRYRQHALLADFAREQLEGDDVAGLNNRFARYFLSFVQRHHDDYDALRPEWDNVMAAMQIAHELQQWQTVIDFADALHDAWFYRGRYTQARAGYKLAHHAAQTVSDPRRQANFLQHWALACLEQREFAEAEQHFDASSALYTRLDHPEGVARNSTYLARIAVEHADYSLAESRIQNGRAIWQKLDSRPGIAETLHVEARLNYFRGRYDETIKLEEEALTYLEGRPEDEKAIRIYSLLASANIMLSDLAAAAVHAQKALTLAERFEQKGDQGVILSVLAYIAYKRTQLDKAQSHGEKSLALLKTTGDLGSQALILYTLGRVYRGLDNPHLALKVGLDSLTLCKQSQFRLQQGWTLIHVAQCYDALDESKLASSYWKKARQLAQELQNPSLLNRIDQLAPSMP